MPTLTTSETEAVMGYFCGTQVPGDTYPHLRDRSFRACQEAPQTSMIEAFQQNVRPAFTRSHRIYPILQIVGRADHCNSLLPIPQPPTVHSRFWFQGTNFLGKFPFVVRTAGNLRKIISPISPSCQRSNRSTSISLSKYPPVYLMRWVGITKGIDALP